MRRAAAFLTDLQIDQLSRGLPVYLLSWQMRALPTATGDICLLDQDKWARKEKKDVAHNAQRR